MKKFKVNDKVRIVKRLYDHEFEIGDEVELMEWCETDWRAVREDDEWWYVKENEIEKLD